MKRALTPLSLAVPKGQGAIPETPVADAAPVSAQAAPPPVQTAPAPPPRTAMTYRPTVATHDRLRAISFRTRRSMQDLVDEAVAAWLEGQQE